MDKSVASENSGNGIAQTAKDQLRSFVERIERLEEEKAALAGDIRELYAQAKSTGFEHKGASHRYPPSQAGGLGASRSRGCSGHLYARSRDARGGLDLADASAAVARTAEDVKRAAVAVLLSNAGELLGKGALPHEAMPHHAGPVESSPSAMICPRLLPPPSLSSVPSGLQKQHEGCWRQIPGAFTPQATPLWRG